MPNPTRISLLNVQNNDRNNTGCKSINFVKKHNLQNSKKHDIIRETLNKTKSTCSHEYTHRSDFVTLRFIQRVPSIDSFHLKLIIIDIWNF